MYSSVHAATGAIIVAASPDPITGLALAFVSHFILDYIGESSIGTIKETAIIEGVLLLIYILACCITSTPWLYIAAWVASNLPDLIDKPNRILRGKKEWFSCHNGEGFFNYKGRKLGYPTVVQLTKDETLSINVASTLYFLLISMFI